MRRSKEREGDVYGEVANKKTQVARSSKMRLLEVRESKGSKRAVWET